MSIAYHMLLVSTCHRDQPPIVWLMWPRWKVCPISDTWSVCRRRSSHEPRSQTDPEWPPHEWPYSSVFCGGVLWWFTWMIPSKMCCERMLFTQIERKKTSWPDSMWLTQQIFFACFWWGGEVICNSARFFHCFSCFQKRSVLGFQN